MERLARAVARFTSKATRCFASLEYIQRLMDLAAISRHPPRKGLPVSRQRTRTNSRPRPRSSAKPAVKQQRRPEGRPEKTRIPYMANRPGAPTPASTRSQKVKKTGRSIAHITASFNNKKKKKQHRHHYRSPGQPPWRGRPRARGFKASRNRAPFRLPSCGRQLGLSTRLAGVEESSSAHKGGLGPTRIGVRAPYALGLKSAHAD